MSRPTSAAPPRPRRRRPARWSGRNTSSRTWTRMPPSSSWTRARPVSSRAPALARRRPAPAAAPPRRCEGEAGRGHRPDPGARQQAAQLGLVDRADRVAARGSRLPGWPGGAPGPGRWSSGPRRRGGPTSPPRRSANRASPTQRTPTGSRSLGPCRGRDRRERPGRGSLPGPLGVDQDRPHPVGQVDGDRAAEDAGPDDHHRPVVVAPHHDLLCRADGGRAPAARVWPPPRFRMRLPAPPGRPFGPTVTRRLDHPGGDPPAEAGLTRRLPWDAAYEMS